MNPQECRYTQEHEWVRMDGDVAVVGITDFAQRQLGDVVFVDLPTVGSSVEQNQPFGSIDSVKTASDLFSPITGQVLEVNASAVDDPALVNSDPYGEGWMMRVQPTDPSQLDTLLTAEQYSEYTRE
ncbi:MAG: glycine cleavage system protein GcvH [Chloroflexota bacterium]|nr:glycine cleavage system protein GcvH [Chloroflexota bacterium]